MTEGFPPHYRTVLERYYRRLAEESKGDEKGTDRPPNTPPARAIPAPSQGTAPKR